MKLVTSPNRRSGLTLIEIIVVIAIITVLVTLTVAMGQYMIRQSMYRATEQVLVALDQATLRYKNDNGIWPYEYDSNGDNLPDNNTKTAVHELTRRKDPNGGIKVPYFEATAQTLRLTDPYTNNRVTYDANTQGYRFVFGPFQDRDGIDVHGWDRGDERVRNNQFMPFWHSGGPDRDREENYVAALGTGWRDWNGNGVWDPGETSDDIFSSCFARD